MQALDRKGCFQAASRLVQCARSSLQHPRLERPQVILRRISERRALHVATSKHEGGHAPPPRSDVLSHHLNPSSEVGATGLHLAQQPRKSSLPATCPGCGALSQVTDAASPGHYTRSRKTVKTFLKASRTRASYAEGDEAAAIEDIVDESTPLTPVSTSVPFCDRCHDLAHNFRGVSIAHPSVEDIADSIAESPHKHNHIYHVLDAADFPMSLIPSIHSSLTLAKPRSQNRRSQHQFTSRPTLSFIITRSDLLAPTKEKVDALMPYLQEVLRKSLGGPGTKMRLGNLHLVSAKRGWWTSAIKDEIWQRGGGSFMVGKFNVGKSALFEVLFPKGSGERATVYAELVKQKAAEIPDYLPESLLLPPPQPEVPFPTLPLVSSLPGTTASPIRLSFGNRKGELIDMPGLDRGNLDQYVQDDHKLDLVMTNRPTVTQHTIKPGQSLLLGGGVVRITPVLEGTDQDMVMLAYPFVPLEAHVTSTEKAIGTQQQERDSGIRSILAPDVGAQFQRAGTFSLETDVTKRHAGAMIRSGMSTSRLPFRVYSTDLLIQGVGWVELVCQVRRRWQDHAPIREEPSGDEVIHKAPDSDLPLFPKLFKPYTPQIDLEFNCPKVEVFTPNGENIGSRQAMGAWTMWKEGKIQRNRNLPSRPRRPMKGDKAQKKRAAQA